MRTSSTWGVTRAHRALGIVLAIAVALATSEEASAQRGEISDVASSDCESASSERREPTVSSAIAIETTAPTAESRIHRFDRMRRTGRRIGFVTTGFVGASMITFTLGYTVDWKRPEDPPPYVSTGELVSILLGGSLALSAVPLAVISGGLLGRSRRQLRLLTDVLPIAAVRPGEGFSLGVVGRF